MTTSNEPDIRRLAYLHEAGHAVVALELDLQVVDVVCDGETGHCRTLYSEDLQHGQVIENQLTIINPFVKSGALGY